MLRTAMLLTAICWSTLVFAQGNVGTEYVYKQVGERPLHLYVVHPAQKGVDRPAIVLFHGGGWTGGKPTQFNDFAKLLAERGMVAIQVEYRLLDRQTKDPPVICIQDAKSAMRFVRSHAKGWGIDPNRIAAGGGSAGGHLAAFVGMVDGHDDPDDDLTISCRAQALVLFNPVYDNGPEGGWGTARVGKRFPEFSPAHNITADDPPAIVFLGTKDSLINVAVAKRFQEAMQKAGVRSELKLYEGQPHGFFNKEPYKSQTIGAAMEFLESLGWLAKS